MDRLSVRVFTRRGSAALVEYVIDGDCRRVLVPPTAIDEDSTVDIEELEMGIPWGMPWEEIVRLRATPEEVGRRLRNAGIWTVDDLNCRIGEAVGVFQAVYGVDAFALLRSARQYLKKTK